MITVADLIAYRRKHDKLIERVVETRLPTAFGEFNVVGYRSLVDDKHHVALVKGEVGGRRRRARARALRVPDRRRLPLAALRLRRAARVGAGADRARGPRRAALPRPGGPRHRPAQQAEGLQAAGRAGSTPSTPTSSSGCPVDLRDYGIGAQILVDLGLELDPDPHQQPEEDLGLEGYGLSVTEQVPIEHAPNPHNERYLPAKRDRLGHTLHHQGLALDEEMLHAEHEHDRDAAGQSGRPRSVT